MRDTNCPDGDRMLLFIAGELADAEAGALEAHTTGCGSCRAALAELRRLTRAVVGAGALAADGIDEAHRSGDCPSDEDIAAYADGSLTGASAEPVERHVAACRACLREVADLWRMEGPETHDASNRSVSAVLARLDVDSRTAVVRLKERAFELLQGFGAELAATVSGEPVAAVATTRAAGAPLTLRWEEAGDVRVEAELTEAGGRALLTGRVTVQGRGVQSASVSMRSGSGTSGPDSPDSGGRFGPWALATGENVITISGLPGTADGRAELTVQLEKKDDQS